jgi:hypothetical protein
MKKTLITVLLLSSVVGGAAHVLAGTGTWVDVTDPKEGYGTATKTNWSGDLVPDHPFGKYGPVPRGSYSVLYGDNSTEGWPVNPLEEVSSYTQAFQTPSECLNATPMVVDSNIAYFLKPADLIHPWTRNSGPVGFGNEMAHCWRGSKTWSSPDRSNLDRVWSLDLALGMRYGWNMNRKKIYNETNIPTDFRYVEWSGFPATSLSQSLTALAVDPATGHKSIFFFGGSILIYNPLDNQRNIYVYDIVDDRWRLKQAKLPYRMALGSATHLNGKIYLIGGGRNIYSPQNPVPYPYDTTGYSHNSDVYVYDLLSDSLTKEGSINDTTYPAGTYPSSWYLDRMFASTTYRMRHRGIAINNAIYLFGGEYGRLAVQYDGYVGCTTPYGMGFSSSTCTSFASNSIEANRGWVWKYDPAAKAFTSYSLYPGDPGINTSRYFVDPDFSSAALSSDGKRVYSLVDQASVFMEYPSLKYLKTPMSSITSTLFTLDLASGAWTPEEMDTKRIFLHAPMGAATSDGGYVAMGAALCESNKCINNLDTKPYQNPVSGNFWIKFFKPLSVTQAETVRVEPTTLQVMHDGSLASIGVITPYLATSTGERTLNALTDVVGKSTPGDTSVSNWAISYNNSNAIQARLLGDLDGDGTITKADSDLALQYAVNNSVLTAFQKMVGDVANNDGLITFADALRLLKAASSTATIPAQYIVQGLASTTASPDAKVTLTYKGTSGVQTVVVPIEVVDTMTLPDLTASLITPTYTDKGVPSTFTFTVSNSMATGTQDGFYNQIQQASDANGTSKSMLKKMQQVTPLAKGASASVTASLTFSAAGTYYLRGCADQSTVGDQYGAIPESNETNNCAPSWTRVNVYECKNLPPNVITYGSLDNITGLTGNTSYKYSASDTADKCEYYCAQNYAYDGTSCVQVAAKQPTVTLTANPLRVKKGSPTTITWSSTDSASCALTRDPSSGWQVLRDLLGQVTDYPTTQSTYTITCVNGTYSATKKVTVNVVPDFTPY